MKTIFFVLFSFLSALSAAGGMIFYRYAVHILPVWCLDNPASSNPTSQPLVVFIATLYGWLVFMSIVFGVRGYDSCR
jgi:hypothetical protein